MSDDMMLWIAIVIFFFISIFAFRFGEYLGQKKQKMLDAKRGKSE